MRVAYYTSVSGRIPVVDYINQQAMPDKARLVEALEGIEHLGFEAPRVGFRIAEKRMKEVL